MLSKLLRTKKARDNFVAGVVITISLAIVLGVCIAVGWVAVYIILGLLAFLGLIAGFAFVIIKAFDWIDRGEE